MTASQRRLVFGGVLFLAAIAFAFAFRSSLVPATHADHDHGILDLDAGGRIIVVSRDGSERNLVGAPGKVLVIHFFDPTSGEAADELRRVFAFQESVKEDPGVDFVLLARGVRFPDLEAWLSRSGLTPPAPASLYVDPRGEATERLNNRRPVETMFFGPDGKLASQARGRLDWTMEGAQRVAAARGGETIE